MSRIVSKALLTSHKKRKKEKRQGGGREKKMISVPFRNLSLIWRDNAGI